MGDCGGDVCGAGGGVSASGGAGALGGVRGGAGDSAGGAGAAVGRAGGSDAAADGGDVRGAGGILAAVLFILDSGEERGDGGALRADHGAADGRPETIPEAGFAPEPEAGGALARKVGAWRRYLLLDGGIGVFGNVLTTLMTCLLAYALLLPKGLLPAGEELAVVQAEFFGNAWGAWGRAVFLLIAAAFLADTWIATADAVARIHTDCVVGFFPRARGVPARRWYVIFFVALTAVTSVTLPLAQPGKLILLNAVIGVVRRWRIRSACWR